MLLDYKLPDGEPWELANAAHLRIPEIPVIFVTGECNESVAIEAVRRGFADYVKKTGGFWNELPAVLERVATLSRIKGHLNESNALMRTIVEHTSDLVAVSNGEGNLVLSVSDVLSPAGPRAQRADRAAVGGFRGPRGPRRRPEPAGYAGREFHKPGNGSMLPQRRLLCLGGGEVGAA